MWEIKGVRTSDEALVQKEFGLKYPPMVKSLLDSDLYKYSMGQVYQRQFAADHATWDFKARNVGEGTTHEKYTAEDREEIEKQIKAYCALRFEKDELAWLGDESRRPWIHNAYLQFLKNWKPDFEEIIIENDEKTGLGIHTHGTQVNVSYYEIPILEISAEVYYRNHYNYDEMAKAFKEKTLEKIDYIKRGIYKPGVFSEFGARRRVSYELQDWLVGQLAEATKDENFRKNCTFVGTSNVDLAKKYNLTAVGTMAHEFIMTVGQGHLYHNPAYSNWYALDAWVKEYGTMNGIALTDTIGTDVFLRDFKKTFATVFSGVRHDSGDPYAWGDKMIAHYKSLGIDPMTKTLMFSDGLNLKKATELNEYFKGKAKVAFGIGTDWSGPQNIEPLNIVCKVAIVNGLHVAKLSDAPGKNMCRSPEAVEHLHIEIDWRMATDK
jgi:nicotinate phosphoribosyltransferase